MELKPDFDICRQCARYHEMVKGGYLYRVCLDLDVIGNGHVIDKHFRVPNDCNYLLEQLVIDAAANTFCPICGEVLNDELKCNEHGDIMSEDGNGHG